MRWLALALVVACGGSKPPSHEPTTTTTTTDAAPASAESELQAFARRACACTDKSCVEAIDHELAAYSDSLPLDSSLHSMNWSDQDPESVHAGTGQRLGECFATQGAAPSEFLNHLAVRSLEIYAHHACACDDDACLDEALDAFRSFDDAKMIPTGVQALADRFRASLGDLGRCLAPVLQTEFAQQRRDVEGFRDRACACADAACAEAMRKELVDYFTRATAIMLVTLSAPDVQAAFTDVVSCVKPIASGG